MITEINRFFNDTSNQITRIKFPKSASYIREWSFMKMQSLASVEFHEECSIKLFPNNLFFGCRSLKTVQVPPSVETIGPGCFSKCSALEKVDFGSQSSLETIKERAFVQCESLNTIIFPDSLKTIEDHAFMECNVQFHISEDSELRYFGVQGSLTIEGDLIVPRHLKIINKDTSIKCCDITTRQVRFLPDAETEVIGDSAFFYDGVNEINVPKSVIKIEKCALANLTSITFEEGSRLKEIGESAFASSNLPILSLPSSLERVHPYAFAGLKCDKLEMNENERFVSDNRGILYSRFEANLVYTNEYKTLDHS